jgi:putative transposase
VSPARRRDAVRFLVKRRRVSERRPCRVVCQHRSTQRYERVAEEYELRLVAAMNELAAAHPRSGYRRVWSLLRSEGWRVNRKRIERIWQLEGHRVPPRRRGSSGGRRAGRRRRRSGTCPRGTRTMSGRTTSWVPVPVTAARSGSSRRRRVHPGRARLTGRALNWPGGVIAELEQLFEKHGRPVVLRSDNGREFIAASLGAWLAEQGVKTAFIEKGSPQQNAFVERFNGTMRDELLNGEEFDNLLEARVVISNWLVEYNELRPHRGLSMMTPAAFAAQLRGTQVRATTLIEPGPVDQQRVPHLERSLRAGRLGRSPNMNGPKAGGHSRASSSRAAAWSRRWQRSCRRRLSPASRGARSTRGQVARLRISKRGLPGNVPDSEPLGFRVVDGAGPPEEGPRI